MTVAVSADGTVLPVSGQKSASEELEQHVMS